MDAYNTLGVIYLRGQMKDAAQQVFAAVLQQEGENLVAVVNLVDVLERLGRTTEAAQWRERLIIAHEIKLLYIFISLPPRQELS